MHVDWGIFLVGSSLFVPAINTAKLKHQMYAIAQEQGWKLTAVERIEDERWGVRFWRLL
jgi:hypothetical protein